MTTTTTHKILHTRVREILRSCEKSGFVQFQKADGTSRDMYFSNIPAAKIKGTAPKVTQKDRTNVWDDDAEGIRCVTHNRVKRLEVNGITYVIVDEL